jgi:hypothetical protein
MQRKQRFNHAFQQQSIVVVARQVRGLVQPDLIQRVICDPAGFQSVHDSRRNQNRKITRSYGHGNVDFLRRRQTYSLTPSATDLEPIRGARGKQWRNIFGTPLSTIQRGVIDE